MKSNEAETICHRWKFDGRINGCINEDSLSYYLYSVSAHIVTENFKIHQIF